MEKHIQLRLLLLFLCLALLPVSLAACDQSLPATPKVEVARTRVTSASPEPSTSAPQPSHTPTITPQPTSALAVDLAELRGATVQLWHIWPGPAGETMQALVADFNAQNEWGITVNATYQGDLDQMSTEIGAALESGETPDLAVANLHQALAWEASRPLVDLVQYVDDPVLGISPQAQADFYPAFWEQDVVNGKRLGLPAQRAGQVLYYNQGWARDLGFNSAPASPDQFKQQACAAAQANQEDDDPQNDHTGGYILNTDYPAMLSWVYSFGAQIVNSNQNGYQFNLTPVRESFTFLRGLYDSGCAWLVESQPAETEFSSRQGLFAVESVSNIPNQAQAFARQANPDEWTVIPFPSPSGKPALDVYGPSYVMFPSSPQQQLAAWLFLKWLLSPEHQAPFIEATGSFPLQASVLDRLVAYRGNHPQWAAAVGLLGGARAEPPFESWSNVRWAISDASTQLFRYYFTIDQVPGLVKLLDETAADLQAGGN